MLKVILILYISLLMMSCRSQNNSQSVTSEVNQNAVTQCSQQPETALKAYNVTPLEFNQSTLTQSGQISQDEMIGYQFSVQAGQTLNYETDDEICIWIYSPNRTLVKEPKLSRNGEYIMQVSTINPTETFEIEITLTSLTDEESNPKNLPRYSISNFPKPSCGDSLPQQEDEYPVTFYAVDIAYSEGNLGQVKNIFCQDAFVKVIEEEERMIQIASFRSLSRSKNFANFIRTEIEETQVRTDSKTIVTQEMLNNDQ
ncbi:MAG: hypothetical protein GVY17_10020 [Cyanobacteria bacterium]|jgi:hypothetical protein|nr:hypothetical protein [Cyanobacteria bacterium GSL.Bin21]